MLGFKYLDAISERTFKDKLIISCPRRFVLLYLGDGNSNSSAKVLCLD